jgi:DNA helicase-2/ATP-dependent DNA helicase PcrA
MKFIADLHIHSKYSRATSKDMTLEELDRWADDKGILVIATGDFTHPDWFKEIKEKLEPAEPGLFKLKPQYKKRTIKGTLAETRFFLSTEISSIYSKHGSTRIGTRIDTDTKRVYRIHNLVFAPDIETVEKINTQLGWIGNLKSDGRPILGLDCQELVKIVVGTNEKCAVVPSHVWTPWFSLFGSMSGFDSIEECFGDYTKYIFAGETGLSSDPAMNWRLSQLDNIALISNSDSHSLQRIGREANIFDTDLSYAGIIEAIKDGIPRLRGSAFSPRESAFVATIEFFPEEGKYHYDGHRLCGVVFSPEETKKHNGICPKCGKKLTIGVMNRVEELADRPPIESESKGFYQSYNNRVPYYNLIPLDEIIADVYGLNVNAKKVKEEYENLIKIFGNELKILLEVKDEEMKGVIDEKIRQGIKAVREKRLKIQPGYDGEYGKIAIFNKVERKEIEPQKTLF